MERPHPGQNAAVCGICAAQCEQDCSGTWVSSIAGTISESGRRHKRRNQFSALTQTIVNSMVVQISQN